MAKFNKHTSDRGRFGKCEICMGNIPVEYYFSEGDQITCYECGTEYTLLSKSPVKLTMLDGYAGDDYFGEMQFDE